LKRQLEFGAKHEVPMFVWAFGLMKNCFVGQGGLEWLRDTKSLFNDRHLYWSYAAYRDEDNGTSDNEPAQKILAGSSKN